MDEEVEAAEPRQDPVDERARRARLPEVGREGLGPRAESSQGRHRLRGGCRIAPEVDGDVVPRTGRFLRRKRAPGGGKLR